MTHTTRTIVDVRDIGKDYGNFSALNNVSLQIEHGSFLTLLGPSGSGKTTLLMVLAGFEQPTRGALHYGGKPLTASAEKRGFGMVFQGYALFPHMSVQDNIAFPLKVKGRSATDIRKRVSDMVDLVGLNGHEHKKPAKLSGGQQQRVALARALAYEPPVILMDEPFSALDKNLRGQMQEELRRLHRELGTTFIFVTHDQSEALALSTDVAIFNQGELQQVAKPDTIYDAPANLFVAEFLGEINILPVEFAGDFAIFNGQKLSIPDGVSTSGSRLGVRPEYMQLLEKPDGTKNSLQCIFHDLIYQGSSTRLLLKSENGTNLSLDVPKTKLPPNISSGDKIWISWDRNNSLIF